ncbi:hypothetical protein HAX54_005555 [Datura stramonium]|uniref:Bet v I/Major latex protein domain-containing protein n=1 Tax=Datura stramonium TaxID=4076 RepID=A0ABS8RUI5_DATST|nr:hypothetical protein [Datura stramonium]
MGLRGKLIAHVEVKCGGELFHDHFNSKPHHIPNISDKINSFEIHEGELGTVGCLVSWKFNFGYFKELYKELTATLDVQENGTIWTIEYEKQNEDIPEPLTLLGRAIDTIKDIDSHHHNK